MNEIKDLIVPFETSEWGSVRVAWKGAAPWFYAVDLARVLKLPNLRDRVSRLNPSERTAINDGASISRSNPILVSESAFYKLIFVSRVPAAQAFQDWVTGTVLPEIRRTGHYVDEKRNLDEQELLRLEAWRAKPLIEWLSRLMHGARDTYMTSEAWNRALDDGPRLPRRRR
jgi:prophage antirepressor-like protein